MLEGIEVLIMQPDRRLVSAAGACNFGGDGAQRQVKEVCLLDDGVCVVE